MTFAAVLQTLSACIRLVPKPLFWELKWCSLEYDYTVLIQASTNQHDALPMKTTSIFVLRNKGSLMLCIMQLLAVLGLPNFTHKIS